MYYVPAGFPCQKQVPLSMAVTLAIVPCCQLTHIPYVFRHCNLLVLKIIISNHCHKKKLKIMKDSFINCQSHKPIELAHSFLLCSCVRFSLCDPFNCISFPKLFQQLSVFSLSSSGLTSALLVLSTVYYLISL